jgi:hypothetical protein
LAKVKLREVVEVVGFDLQISVEAAHADRPAAFARPKQNLTASTSSYAFFIGGMVRLHDRIGKIGNTIGSVCCLGHILMGPLKRDGTCSPVDGWSKLPTPTEWSSTQPVLSVVNKIRNHLIFHRFAAGAPPAAHRAPHEAAEFEHCHED